MKLLEVKAQNHETKVCYILSQFRRIMNYFRKLMKLVEHSSSFG